MTRLRRLTAALVVSALLLAGCGLPDRTDPKYVGPAADPKPAQDRAQDPPRPDGASSLLDLVSRYLMTSVGGNVTSTDDPNAVSETQTRMKTFMTEQAAAQWSPRPQMPLIVVRVALAKADDVGTDKSRVTANFVAIGQLDRVGHLGPALLDKPAWSEDFEGEEIGGQLRLTKVPSYMLLSVAGLKEWYQPQPIYFWESGVDAPKLVPDLRYMPRVLPASKRVSEVMLWLTTGPSSWLGQVVDRVSPDIETKDDPTVGPDKRVTVNLSSKAAGKSPEDLRKLSRQIRWSLDGHPAVELSFENAKDTTNASDGYEDDNAAVGEVDQEKFVVDGNVAEVRPVDMPAGGPPELFAPGPFNTGVVSATINRAHTKAALVRKVANSTGRQLYVSVPGSAADPKYVVVSDIPASATLSRPAWINRPAQRFLIADGTRLWAVTPPARAGEAAKAEVVPGINELAITNVSAFSVAPDGRRIALIVGNKAWIAVLRIENGRLSLGEQHLVATSLGDNQAIGWITETTLAIGGRANPANGLFSEGSYSLISTSIDGTGEMPLPLLKPTATGAYTVSQLSVRTNDPTDSLQQVLVLFEANQVARVVFADDTPDIKLTNDNPKPGASATQAPKPPLSPFYAD
ncbi:LpqB family beta-propeller domain-containing protein [Dactylosporangium sp. NBC_01737]|uniref:LpqB family beta-propeller domain-containing protein n=1 Tax=Dactylosporangium sp. NBC_01737 TaxID=2975959 RepID=UPI002E15612A|nr:LpqB family beta-propeller domain-containing protein [Dactylosporangium sp. NBC_01737]